MQWEGKPWHGLSGALKAQFGKKMIKLSLSGGFTCPNRDGTAGYGGCSFCSPNGSGTFAGAPDAPIQAQLAAQKILLEQKWPGAGYIAYFQSFTGTYGPPAVLQSLYGQALAVPGVEGIAIATRPDCLGPEVLAVLAALSRRTFLWVELGLQTVHDETAAAFGRGYPTRRFHEAYGALQALGIPVVVHLINGLPGETDAMMLQSARQVGALKPWGIKLHLLHVLRGTALEAQWGRGLYAPMTREAYVSLVADQLELLPADTVIHRLTGDGPREQLLAPNWSLDKKRTLGAIEETLRRRGSWQGCRYEKGTG